MMMSMSPMVCLLLQRRERRPLELNRKVRGPAGPRFGSRGDHRRATNLDRGSGIKAGVRRNACLREPPKLIRLRFRVRQVEGNVPTATCRNGKQHLVDGWMIGATHIGWVSTPVDLNRASLS